MSLAKLVAACGLMAVALIVSACGIQAKPVAGTVHLNASSGNHSYVTDPRTRYLPCLRSDGFHLTEFTTGRFHLRSIQVNSRPDGPTVVFEPTTGIAEGDQIEGEETGAEVLGDALVYPNRTPDATMIQVESCLQIGVKG